MRRRQAFTLVELLVVVGIIAILAAILFPVLTQAREKARQATCMSNQHQLALLAIQCAQDHDGIFPSADVIWNTLETPNGILTCPTEGKSTKNAYVINNIIPGANTESFENPSDTAMTFDGAHKASDLADSYDNIAYSWRDVDKRHQEKFIASFLDGHVAMTAEMPIFVHLSTSQTASSSPYASSLVVPGLEIWFASDWGITQNPNPNVIRWLDRGKFQLKAHPANKNHQPLYVSSVPSLGGAPALFFKPPNNNPNMLVTEDISAAWGTTHDEATMFIVFQPMGHSDNYEYSVFDQHNGDPLQATRLRQGSQGGKYPGAASLSSPGAQAVSVDLTASPTTINAGQSTTLSWTSTDSPQVVKNETNFNAQSANGSLAVSPPETTTYTITVKKGKEKVSDSVTVTVIPDTPVNEPTVNLTANPTSTDPGGDVTLTWSSTDATSVVSSNFGAGGVSGSKTVNPVINTTYTITVSGPGGEASASVTVTVNEHPGSGEFGGRISWFRKTSAEMYPPNNVPWNTPTMWTIVSSHDQYTAYQMGQPWVDYVGGPDWLTPDYFTIGGSTKGQTANQRSFDGYIGEIIIFRRVLNEKERKQIEKYLMVKFGLK